MILSIEYWLLPTQALQYDWNPVYHPLLILITNYATTRKTFVKNFFCKSISAIVEGSRIQRENDVSEVPVVTPHASPGHSGRDDGKTEKSRGPFEGNSSKNNKDGYRERSQSPTKNNVSPSKERKHSKKSKKRKRKRRYSSSSSATNTTSDSDSSENDPAIKRFKVVPRTKDTNIKYRNQWLPLQMNILNCTSQSRSYTPTY